MYHVLELFMFLLSDSLCSHASFVLRVPPDGPVYKKKKSQDPGGSLVLLADGATPTPTPSGYNFSVLLPGRWAWSLLQ